VSGILWGKFKQIVRKPGGFLVTSVICIVFAYLIGLSSFTKIEIPVFTDSSKQMDVIVKELNQSESYTFVVYPKEEVKKMVEEGKAELGIYLEEDQFTIYREAETSNVFAVQNLIEKYYQNMIREQQIISLAEDKQKAETILEENKENPIIPLKKDSSPSEKDTSYSQSLQALFGFTLFFSIYTVAFTVVDILREKKNGIWDRLILSSTSKTQIYLGNLVFSFLVGYFQIALIYIIFKYGLNISFNGNFHLTFLLIIPYLFSIVALTILITGLVKTVSQFNVLIPLISVSFAMLGGAYWPIEIVTSKVMIFISKFIPITYGMELLKKGVLGDGTMMELLKPAGILLLMGTIMLGIGIQFIERRHI